MKIFTRSVTTTLAAFAALAGLPARADNMVSIGITPETGVVTLVPRWSIAGNLGGFHQMAQDLSLGGGANQFYSIKSTAIPQGGDVAGFTLYIAGSGAATNHVDIGSKLTPDSYSALTSADSDVGYGSVNLYFIHHKSSGDYFSVIKPSSGTASEVTDLRPMSGPGGPSTVGASGYLGLTFAAANLGYGLNLFYYLRTDPVTGFTKFGTMDPGLAGISADEFDLGMGGYRALAFTGTEVGFGPDKMYYLRLDPVTGFTILGTLHPVSGRIADIANLGSVYSTLTFVPTDLGFGSGKFYSTGAVNPTWQSVSFAAIEDRAIINGSFTVNPTASSGLPIVLTLVAGSARISAPVGGVFTVTPLAPGRITLQAAQAGQAAPIAYEYNMLRQSFTASGAATGSVTSDFDGDGRSEPLWRNSANTLINSWTMAGGYFNFGPESGGWQVAEAGDFDGDGRTELLWRNINTHQTAVWTMAGGYLNFGPENDGWQVIGVGDFDGDGRAEPLWRNTSSTQISTWTVAGGYLNFGLESGGWQVVAVGDFDGDGRTEPLWRNTSSTQISTWTMAGGYLNFGTVSGWQVVAVGDFDGDGRTEPLWRNTSSTQISTWTMAGGYLNFGPESGGWQVVDVGDYDGDGRTEPLWRNTSSAQISTWTMAGGYLDFGPESGGWQLKHL